MPIASARSYAAIDLGSNSFHMVIAEPEGNSIRIIDSLRMPTRLGAGLDKKKCIKPETMEAALAAMSQFAERLRGVPRHNVRIVGTNTLRRATNAKFFMAKCEVMLGKRIEIISGREEARLIHTAVSHVLPDADSKRLVIDIGGGSTEFVIGTGFKADLMESVNMGCVSYATEYFDTDQVDNAAMKKAAVQAQLEMRPIAQEYREAGWQEVIGCSGTIKATARMLAELGLTDGTITREGLRKLIRRITKDGSVEALKLTSISQSRTQVIAGGLAVLNGIMKTLDIDSMVASQVALREGLIFDMIGKAEHIDIQSQTLANLVTRYSINVMQADRVEKTAARLFAHTADTWELDPEIDLTLLRWAAKLHELGMGVAHTQYHKHGAYILENSDLLGFSMAEQNALALLIRFHRRKINMEAFDGLPKTERHRLLKLLSLLRLAALLHRGRHNTSLEDLHVNVKDMKLIIDAPQRWLDENPLTCAELSAEATRNLYVDIRLDATEPTNTGD